MELNQPDKPRRPVIRFWDRLGCSVQEAGIATGLGRTKIYELIAEGRIKSTRVDCRRVISVASLRELIEGGATASAA